MNFELYLGRGFISLSMHPVLFCMLQLPIALSVLPRGYEDELFCPPDMCLKHNPKPTGWSGPRTAFHICCNETSGSTRAPIPWGVKVPQKLKDKLLEHNFHQTWCKEADGKCGELKVKCRRWAKGLLHRVDTLLKQFST
jgi:hypothetical protein